MSSFGAQHLPGAQPTSAAIRIGRRTLLGSVLAGAAAAAVGCSVDTGSAEGPGGSSAAQSKIKFPDYSTQVEAGGTVRWLDSGDLKSVFETAVLDAFSAKHTKIKNDYQGTSWDTVQQVLSLGIRNSSAPDVFQLPPAIPAQTAIAQKWVQPIEDLIPDFDNWRKQWPKTALIPGVHIFDGKVYSFPLNSSRRLDKMMFVDTANLKAAGYDDPIAQIKNWDDIHTALGKVVKTGKSGLMIARDGLGATVQGLATTLGWKGSLNSWQGMDMKTGRFIYDAPEVIEAFEFLQKLVKDKLVVPGFLTLLDKDARTQFSAGKTGMMFVGPYSLPAWKQQAPNWKYDVGQLPSVDGSDYVVPFAETGANNSWVYAKTKLPRAVGQILGYMGSPEGQKNMVILSEGNLESLQEGANTAADRDAVLDQHAKFCTTLAGRIMHSVPQVELRNPDVAKVRLLLKPVTPIWQDLMQGLFTGDLSNPKAQFSKYNSALDKTLDDAIAAAKKKGSSVTRDDFVFPNWDPATDYTTADYQQL
jgi:multiple sugar transport system substrate-binding protein